MSGFAQEEKTLRVLNMNFWVFKNWVEQITYDQQSNQGRSFGKLSPDRLALGMLRLIWKPVFCVCSYFCSPEKLVIRASCYWFGHPATDSRILLLIQASCYRFRHLATDSGNLLQGHAICYRVMQLATGSCNWLQGPAIGYRVMQLGTRSCNLLQGHAICYRFMQSVCNLF